MPVQYGSKPGPCKGKKFLVTGGARGLGKELVTELYAQGATVYALGRNKDNLRTLQEELPGVKTIAADLSNWDETRKALEDLEPIDGLINSASGHAAATPFWEITPDKLDHMFQIDFKAAVNISQIVAKKMVERGAGGAIVNMLGCDVRRIFPPLLGVNCIKSALETLTKGMALELAPHKITVNAVAPTSINVGLIKDGLATGDEETKKEIQGMVKLLADRMPTGAPWVEPEEVISTILFFASGVHSQVTGQTLLVDGGFSISF